MIILFIRHGETDVNAAGVMHKTGDPEGLNANGKKQAKAVAKVCRDHHVKFIFCSPERRSKETAEIIAKTLKLKISDLEELKERDWREWSGRPWEEVKSTLDRMTLEQRYKFVPPGGESWEKLEERLKDALKTITRADVEAAAVVTHAGTIRAFLPILNKAPKESSFRIFDNGSVTIFEYSDGQYREIAVNDTSHIQ